MKWNNMPIPLCYDISLALLKTYPLWWSHSSLISLRCVCETLCFWETHYTQPIFPSSSVGKESGCNAGDLGSIPGTGRSPGEGNGSPLQYSCLENPMDRGAWQATVQGVAGVGHDLVTKSPPPLSSHLQDYFKHKEGPPLHTGEGWGSLPRRNDGYIDSERQREKNE